MERRSLLFYALRLWREWGNGQWVARTLGFLSDANRLLDLYEEGTRQAREALETSERFHSKSNQAESWCQLSSLLYEDDQLDAAVGSCFPSARSPPRRRRSIWGLPMPSSPRPHISQQARDREGHPRRPSGSHPPPTGPTNGLPTTSMMLLVSVTAKCLLLCILSSHCFSLVYILRYPVPIPLVAFVSLVSRML